MLPATYTSFFGKILDCSFLQLILSIWACNMKFGTKFGWRKTCINLPLLWQSLMLHPGEREGDRKHYHTGYISARISPCCSSFPLLLTKTFSKHCIYQPGFYGLFFLLIIATQHFVNITIYSVKIRQDFLRFFFFSSFGKYYHTGHISAWISLFSHQCNLFLNKLYWWAKHYQFTYMVYITV